MKIDVHNYSVEEAIDEILYKLEECRELEVIKIEIIHGYRHGTKIREYIRSYKFNKEISRKGYQITQKNQINQGSTILELKTQKKIQNKRSPDFFLNYCHKCNKIMRPLNLPNTYICPNCGAFKKNTKN